MIDGEVIEELESGTLFITYRNGKKNGPSRFEIEPGINEVIMNYEDDLLSGEYIQYYRNGAVMNVMNYSEGILNGPFNSYFENGMIQMSANYSDGAYHGLVTSYDEFGDVISEVPYVQGIIHGKKTIYYPRSQGGGILEVSFYENGLLTGNKILYYNTGEVMSVTPYLNGRPQRYPRLFNKK